MRLISALLGTAALAGVLAAVAAATPHGARDSNVALVAYSTPKEAYGKLISAFQQTAAGKGVSFDQSYGASGDQSRSVVGGLPADIVHLALDPDVTALVKAGLVPKTWQKAAYKGIVSRSVVVFVVRNGNPKHIKKWGDLIKPGVQVITPNPFTSGGARWNVMAGYGAMLREKKTPKQATAYLQQLFKHVPVQDKSAREALQTFLAGKGDVLLTYENEAILAQKKNQPVYYVIPKATIRIETPVALTVAGAKKPAAKAFFKFLFSAQAQQIFGENGYRPVLKRALAKFSYPARPQLFTIGYVGGWPTVQKKFFDPNNGIMAKIERGIGVSTGG